MAEQTDSALPFGSEATGGDRASAPVEEKFKIADADGNGKLEGEEWSSGHERSGVRERWESRQHLGMQEESIFG